MYSRILFLTKQLHVGKKDPPWMTDEVKIICHIKAKIYENYVKNGRSDVDKCSDVITKAKEKYLYILGNKLNDPQTGAKSYSSILNKFLHKKKFLLSHQFYGMAHLSQIYTKQLPYSTRFSLTNVL